VLDITGADFPSSGGDLVTALATELGFPFLSSRKNRGTRAGRTR
jgi:hypothetical protein